MGTIYLIGLGLGTLAQVNSEAFEAAEKVDELYLDTYTSFLERSLLDELKKRFSEKLIEADRGLLEEDISEIVSKARDKDIGILVPGDPMIATTHLSIMVEAAKKNISCKIIHGTSAYCAVISASCLHAYKFGRTTTIPKSGVGVETCYRVIAENMERGLHSLILLDTADGGLAIPEALEFLLKVEEKLGLGIFSENLLVICLARIGFMDEFKWAGKMRNALTNPYPPPPHSIVIPGELHFSDISFDLSRLIKNFEPFGQGNSKPKFISTNVKILKAETMGKEGEHLRFSFVQDGIVMQGVKFKSKEVFEENTEVTLTYTVNENYFRGNTTLQLMIDKVTL